EPVDRDLLEPSAERRRLPGERVLVVGRGPPVGHDGGGPAAADDLVEESRSGRAERRRARGRELTDRRQRPGAVLRKRATERLGRCEGARTGDLVRVERREVRLPLAQRKPERVDDELALGQGIASTQRTRP